MQVQAKPLLERKVLTLCGQRGINPGDPGYTWASIERGYARLNARIHRLQLTNPGLVIHSINQSCVLIPTPTLPLALVSVNIVYAGTIVDKQAIHGSGDPERTARADSDDLEDSGSGYGTVYRVNL
jgi:hypothetical protein